MSTSWRMLSVRPTAPTEADNIIGGNVTPLLPMNRWSYSTAMDQFGAKPNSRPVPTAPPQRVSAARFHTSPGANPGGAAGPVKKELYLLSVTAAPPFTYQRTLFQA